MSAGDHLSPQLFDPGPEMPSPKRFPYKGEIREQYVIPLPDSEEIFEKQDEVRGGRLQVRAPHHALPRILKDQALKTQNETGTSGGGFAPGERRRHEQSMGFTDHPVYGSIENPSSDRASESQHYGPARFTMKDSVRDRTTVTEGDSWIEGVEGLAPPNVREVEAGERELPNLTEGYGSSELYYIEAQIHNPDGKGYGRVPLSDVASLDLDHSYGVQPSREELTNLGQQFQDVGISTWHNTTDIAYQSPLPFTSEELSAQGFSQHPGDRLLRTTSRGFYPENYAVIKRSTHQSRMK